MAELPHMGEHCAVDLCKQLDYLPVKCDMCSSFFCSTHFSYDAHACAFRGMKDVRVPVCPLCSKPVPTPKGMSPDEQVDRHINNDCAIRKKKLTYNCSFPGCRKKEFVRVECPACHKNYCLTHRFENDHRCERLQKPVTKNSTIIAHNQQYIAEDEALARALAASLNNPKPRPRQRTPTSDKCIIA